MKSKGTQMRKFSTFKEAAQKIVIKKPWGVEIKSYKAGDPIPAGVEFKIFNATDTDKIEAYADGIEESADYQKERFKEPAYMYESVSNKNIKSADDLYEWLTEYMRKHSSNRFTTLQIILGNGNNITFAWDMKANKGIHEGDKDYTMSEFVYKFMDPVIKNSGISDIWEVDMNTGRFKPTKESFVIQDSNSNNKPVYFHYGKYTGYDWGFDKNAATKFSTKEAAERMIEKMRQEGMLINSMKVIEEAKSADNFKVMDKVWYSESGNGDDIEKIGIQGTILNRSANTIKVGNQKMHGKDIPHNMAEYRISDKHWWKIDEGFLITGPSIEGKTFYVRSKDGQGTTFDRGNAFIFNSEKEAKDTIEKMKKAGYYTDKIEVIKEGRIARGYENLDADERAKHLLSHPTSKYMSDLKSENITERAIRKAVKEMLGKPAKDDPQFITDVNEEGEAPAVATSTANVANPELPLKLKEDLESDKAEALADYKKAKAEYLANKSDENWKKFSDAKAKCMQLGCRI